MTFLHTVTFFCVIATVAATNWFTSTYYIGDNDCSNSGYLSLMYATGFCGAAGSGYYSMISDDCMTLSTYSNSECAGTALFSLSFTSILGNYSTLNKCYDTSMETDDYTVYLSQKTTCTKDPNWLAQPGYATFTSATSASGCSVNTSSSLVPTMAYGTSCSTARVVISGVTQSSSMKALTKDNELLLRTYYTGSCSGSVYVDSVIISELGSCGQYESADDDLVPSIASAKLRSESSASEITKSILYKTFGSRQAVEKLVEPITTRFSKLVGASSGAYVYGATKTGNIPYVSDVIVATGGSNPADASSGSNDNSLSGGVIAAIVIVLLLVATAGAYYFYRQHTKKSAMALQETSNNPIPAAAVATPSNSKF